MITAIIIEDEPAGRKLIQRLLETHCPEVQVLEAVPSAGEGRKAISRHKPDVVFLDVEMPGESGIEMLRDLAPVDFKVVFVTAHQDYAIEAIRLSAIDYLLKPVRTEELISAIRRVRDTTDNVDRAEQMKALIDNLAEKDQKIGISTKRGILFVPISDIVRCESESNYTRIFLAGGDHHVASRTLKHFEELLGRHRFVRVHQSHLVNARFIAEYVRGDGGTLVLTNGHSVDVSRRYKARLMGALEGS
jgi:two-component system LytT family response regulator